MVRQNSLIKRLGNKTNDIKFFRELLPLDVKNVVETFGGSFAVIRNVYQDDKYKKFVNDLDNDLYLIYTNYNDYKDYTIKMNDILLKYAINNYRHTDNNKILEDTDFIENKKSKFYDYWASNNIVKGIIFKTLKNIDDDTLSNEIKIINNITFTNQDYKINLLNHIYDPDTFIFLDPPYLFSDNSSYIPQTENTDSTNIIIDILKLFEDRHVKCKIMLIINDLAIIRYLFKTFIKGSYKRIYQMGKKQMNHLIICNY